MKFPMTGRQQQVYDFLVSHKGIPPSYQEIADALNFPSKGNVHRILHCLRERGQINFIPGKWRTLKVL